MTPSLTTRIEALLFASAKPISKKVLMKILAVTSEDFDHAVSELMTARNQANSGISLMDHDEQLQFVTNPICAADVATLAREEVSGELTRPSLETLTIIAYRAPVTKPEIEQIRGVNCSLILRNLLMRGLIEEHEDRARLQSVYTVSMDFLRHLGLHRMEELPEYAELHGLDLIGSAPVPMPNV